MRTVDINSDLGESFGNWRMGNDEALIPQITSANVACGFHASDPVTMLRTVRVCKEHGVLVGAHPGLPDLLGFGRRWMKLSPEDLYSYIAYQVGALWGTLAANGMALHHVKPHGIMPSMLRESDGLGAAAADSIADVGATMAYFPAPIDDSTIFTRLRARGVQVVGEIYPDLSYAPDGKLVIQRHKKATDVEAAAGQVRRFLEEGCVSAEDGTPVYLEADSVCVHGDGPNAIEVVHAIRRAIEAAGCAVGPIPSTVSAGARGS